MLIKSLVYFWSFYPSRRPFCLNVGNWFSIFYDSIVFVAPSLPLCACVISGHGLEDLNRGTMHCVFLKGRKPVHRTHDWGKWNDTCCLSGYVSPAECVGGYKTCITCMKKIHMTPSYLYSFHSSYTSIPGVVCTALQLPCELSLWPYSLSMDPYHSLTHFFPPAWLSLSECAEKF